MSQLTPSKPPASDAMRRVIDALEQTSLQRRAAPPLELASVSAREAALWLGVSAPTALRLLRETAIKPNRSGVFPMRALAGLSPAPPARRQRVWQIRVLDAGMGAWGTAAVAAGLAQGLPLTGHPCALTLHRDSPLWEHFGATAPNAQYGSVWSEPEQTWARITHQAPGDMTGETADLTLVVCRESAHGLRVAARILRDLAGSASAARLLAKRGTLPRPALPLAWPLLPDLDDAQASGCPLTPLSRTTARVPPRTAQALRVAIARLVAAVSASLES